MVSCFASIAVPLYPIRSISNVEWQDIMARLAQWHRIKPKKVIAAAQKNPAVVNLEDDSGWTALHFAAVFGKEETVQGLLEAGADPNWETEEFEEHGTWRGFLPGSTPLHCAADGFIPDAPESGLVDKAKVLKLLLAAGADATAADDAGWTPLHSVALQVRNNNWQWWNGSGGKQLLADMMSALIAAGASLDAADEQGLTPRRLLLQYAVQTMGAAAAAQLTGVPQAELEKLAPGKDFPSW